MQACPVNSFNEWDPLEEVIVGTPFGMGSMRVHKDPVLLALLGAYDIPDTMCGAGKPFNKESIAAGTRQLDNFVRVLQNEGVTVRRPDEHNHAVPVKTPDWEVPVCNAATCPRDSLIVFGNEIIEAPMSVRGRFFEYRSFRTLVQNYWQQGAIWTSAPKPILSDATFDQNYPISPIGTKEQRAEEIQKGNLGITDVEPVWDAADFLRCGKDVFGQHSLATNLSGIEWVRRHLAPRGFRVHTLQFNNLKPRHIDDTLVAVRPGILLNATTIPLLYGDDLFAKSDWRIIKIPPTSPTCSLNINMLSLNDKTVIVEEKEQETVKVMESLGCRVLQIPFSDVYSLGGSTHCCTLDVRRRGGMQSYFPHLDQLEKEKLATQTALGFVTSN